MLDFIRDWFSVPVIMAVWLVFMVALVSSVSFDMNKAKNKLKNLRKKK